MPFRIEGKSNTPNTIRRIEAQFLQIGVSRPAKGVYSRTAKHGPKVSQQSRLSEQFIRHRRRQSIELWLELLVKNDDPRQASTMHCKTYAVNGILPLKHNLAGFPSTVCRFTAL